MSAPPKDELPELTQLCAVMAHDLKNPLAALMTNLHFLEDGPVASDPEQAEALDDSVMLCEVLERYMKNLDLLGRSAGSIERRFLSSVAQIAADVVARVEKQARAGQVKIAFKRAGDAVAFVDREMCSRALENIIANAVESAPRSTEVVVSIASSPDEVTVTVSDARQVMPERVGTGKREVHARFGRGLSLLCAELAARRCGARVEIDGAPGACTVRFIARTQQTGEGG